MASIVQKPSIFHVSAHMDQETLRMLEFINESPMNSENKPESDKYLILASVLACLTIQVIDDDPEKKLHLTFPVWLTSGVYPPKAVEEIKEIVNLQMNDTFKMNPIQEFIRIILDLQTQSIHDLYQKKILRLSPEQIMQNVIQQISTSIKKNPSTGKNEFEIIFPNWFMDGPFSKDFKNMVSQEITEKTMEHLNREYDMKCVDYTIEDKNKKLS